MRLEGEATETLPHCHSANRPNKLQETWKQEATVVLYLSGFGSQVIQKKQDELLMLRKTLDT